MLGSTLAPTKDVHALIPGAYESVTFHGRRHFADVTEYRIVKWGDYPGLVHGSHSHLKGPHGEKGRSEKQNCDKRSRGQSDVARIQGIQ